RTATPRSAQCRCGLCRGRTESPGEFRPYPWRSRSAIGPSNQKALIQIILLLFIVLLAVLTVRRFLASAPSEALAKKIRPGLIWSGILAVLALAATGRLGWLLPVVGAVIAAVLRLAPVLVQILVQYLPLIRRWQQQRAAARQTATDGSRNSSFVESRFLRMQ